ncbi:MAG: cytochrome c biogenesis protein ResB [Thermodesulfobacteriota bacterium]
MEKEENRSPIRAIWDFFSSVRLTIAVLLTLAATSIIGTLIPQNQAPEEYFRAFGPFFYSMFNVLGIFDMYHSWWFQFLLFSLMANILVCSMNRISATWKVVFPKIPVFHIARFRSIPEKKEFFESRLPHEIEKEYESLVSRRFRFVKTELMENGFCIFAEKGRWTRLGVYMVHLSVITLLVGALIGSIFGFEGFVNIPEGETINSIRLRKSDTVHPLDFSVRCNDFDVSFYDSGAPREYRSSLTILRDGNEIFQKSIVVNDPLRYKGINFFQSSYGTLPPDSISLKLVGKDSGIVYTLKAMMNQELELPEGEGMFLYTGFRGSFPFRGHDLGATAVGIIKNPEKKRVDVVLPVKFPSFDQMRQGGLLISVGDYQPRYYTGLQVTRDPGVWVVYSGFILMILGCYITFFMSHQRVCIEVTKTGKKSKVMISGTANKNKLGILSTIRKLARSMTIDK